MEMTLLLSKILGPGEAMPQCVRGDMLVDPGALSRLPHGEPDNLRRDGFVDPPVSNRSGE